METDCFLCGKNLLFTGLYLYRKNTPPQLGRVFPISYSLLEQILRDYQGADKSLARPGRKQARKHVRDARDFNNIETLVVIKFFSPARKGPEGNSRHSDRNISRYVYIKMHCMLLSLATQSQHQNSALKQHSQVPTTVPILS